MERYDVVVAGGGIGGSGVATVLARAGLSVCVVEPTVEFPDIVRGEWMAPWGVAHAQATGVYDVLASAGGHHIARHVTFDEGIAPDEAIGDPLPLDLMVPGVAGPLALRHPVACQALADAASAAGAVVHRGVTDVGLGPDRVVSFTLDGVRHEAQGRIVVGADGRSSSVRKAIGVELERSETEHFLAGILLGGLGFLGDDTVEYAATMQDRHALLFPQGGGRARVYLNYGDDQKDQYGGSDHDRAAAYLAALEMDCWPGSEGFRDAVVEGPAKGYRSIDTWCERPFAEGVVLVGDAAGHNDPLIGQGLSITSADTRAVTEALLSTDDWSPGLFEDYGRERVERLRRLRGTARVYALAVAGRYWAGSAEARAELRANPIVAMLMATLVLGPYALPDDVYDPATLDALLAAPAS